MMGRLVWNSHSVCGAHVKRFLKAVSGADAGIEFRTSQTDNMECPCCYQINAVTDIPNSGILGTICGADDIKSGF